ncbi:IPT/TIG domain-containing protein [bacterium SCSIO 12741]|nr:IPT/TIG domain-containing protein [bacterium SCSIO 12741]
MKFLKYLSLAIVLFSTSLLNAQIDVGISTISSPATGSTVSPVVTQVGFDIRNYGTMTLPMNHSDTVFIECLINNNLVETYIRPLATAALAPGASESWNINFDFGNYNLTPGSTFTYCLRTRLKSDPTSSNDTRCVSYTLASQGFDLGVGPGSVEITNPTGYNPNSTIPIGTPLNELAFDVVNYGSSSVPAGTTITIDLKIGNGTTIPLSGSLGQTLAAGGTTNFTIDCSPAGIDESLPTVTGGFQICVETTMSNDPNTNNDGSCSSWAMVTGGGSQPTIDYLSTNAGPVGSKVTVFGKNFSTSNIAVYFSPGVPGNVTRSTSTEVDVTVPVGANSGVIALVSNGTPVNGPYFTVTTTPIHTITSISPNAGQVGSQVTINGSGFSTNPSDHTVRFGSAAAVATVNSSTANQLIVTVPNNAVTGNVEVRLNGFFAVSPDTFTVTTGPVPSITDFNPKTGAPGMEVTITGTNFDPIAANNTVTFNGANATVKSGNASQLIVEVPAGATTGKISLTTGGITVQSATDFNVVTTPIITDFNPKQGPVQTTVTIEGFNFSPVAANNTVYFGTAQAGTPVASADGKKLIVEVPFNAKAGAQSVSVEVNGFTEISNMTFSVSALSVEEIKGVKINKVYYANNEVVLDLQNAQSLSDLSLSVFNLEGKLIATRQINAGTQVNQRLALELSNGTYVVSVAEKGQALVAKKIVVAQ